MLDNWFFFLKLKGERQEFWRGDLQEEKTAVLCLKLLTALPSGCYPAGVESVPGRTSTWILVT